MATPGTLPTPPSGPIISLSDLYGGTGKQVAPPAAPPVSTIAPTPPPQDSSALDDRSIPQQFSDLMGSLDDVTKKIENYTPAGRAQHPILSRVGDLTRNAKELLLGGQQAGKPMGTSSGVANNPIISLIAAAPALAEAGEAGTALLEKHVGAGLEDLHTGKTFTRDLPTVQRAASKAPAVKQLAAPSPVIDVQGREVAPAPKTTEVSSQVASQKSDEPTGALAPYGGIERRGAYSFGRTPGKFGDAVNSAFNSARNAEISASAPPSKLPDGMSIKTTDALDGSIAENTSSTTLSSKGKEVGHVWVDYAPKAADLAGTKTAEINHTILDQDYQNKGLGKQMYQTAIENAKTKGVSRIVSDTDRSPEAERLWSSLAKDYPVTTIGTGDTARYSIDLTQPKDSEVSDSIESRKQDIHPALDALNKPELGYHTDDAGGMMRVSPSFIRPDGKVTYLGHDLHPTAITKAAPEYSGTETDRTRFINDTGAIRVRPVMDQREGETFHVTVPEKGVTHDQMDALKKMQSTVRYGNLMAETASKPSQLRTNMDNPKDWQYKSANDVEKILSQIGVHPDQKVLLNDLYGDKGSFIGNTVQSRAGVDFPGNFEKDNFASRRTTGNNMFDPEGYITGEEMDKGMTPKNSHRDFPNEEAYQDVVHNLSGTSVEDIAKKYPRVLNDPSVSESLATRQRDWDKQLPGAPEGTTIRQRYLDNLGVTHGPGLMEIPKHLIGPGSSTEGTIAHEWAHAVVAHLNDIPVEDIRSHLHPDAPDGAAAVTKLDLTHLPGATPTKTGASFTPEGLSQLWPKMLHVWTAGGAMEDLEYGLPFAKNPGVAGDMAQARATGRAMGFDRDMTLESRLIIGQRQVKKLLSDPAITSIIKTASATREEGLSKSLHASAEKVQDVLKQVREARKNVGNQIGSTERSVDTKLGNSAGGSVPKAEPEGAGGVSSTGAESAGEQPDQAIQGTLFSKTADSWNKIADLHDANGGATYNLAENKDLNGTDNYSVSTHPDRTEEIKGELTPQAIQTFAAKNADLLKDKTESLGTWKRPADGVHVLDVVKTIPNRDEAVQLGFEHKQDAIFDLKNGKEIFMKDEQAPVSAAVASRQETPTVSTRVPTRTVKGETVEDHTNQSLVSDMEAAKAAPGYVEKMVNRVRNIPGFVSPEGGDAQATADAFIRHAADNVKFVHSKLAEAEIKRDEQWYPVGAHERGIDVAKTHGITPAQAYAVTSVESPMTAWDQNTSLAERTVDIWKNQQDTKFTPEMKDAAAKITAIPANKSFKKAFKPIEGKTLGELSSDVDRALWLRLYDEGHNPRTYQTWGPDAKSLGLAKNTDGTDAKVGWSFQNHIQKAISILKDGSPENISKQLGYGHKVRNFYNNQAAPDDPRFLTIDTHAGATGQLRPLSGKNPAISNIFGTISNGPNGLNGTYPLYDAAYRLAAKELDISIPSRLQSPTWVKIREVFSDDFKTKENLDAVDAIWKEHADGKITADQARQRIWDYAAGWHARTPQENGPSSDPGELPASSVLGASSEGTAGWGNRSRIAAPASDKTLDKQSAKIAKTEADRVAKRKAELDAHVARMKQGISALGTKK